MGVAQTDVYLLMAYARLYDCERLVLLYPQHGGLAGPLAAHHRIAEPGGAARLTIATVDVSSHAAARASLEALLTISMAV